jgi:hypothetical protein
MNRVIILMLITSVVFAAACGRNAPRGAQTGAAEKAAEKVSAVNQCSLLTPLEIGEVLGQHVDAVEHRGSPRPHCRYSVGGGSVTVFVFEDPTAKGGFMVGKKAQDAHTEPAAGVGDDAYWSPDIRTLNVLQGETYFTVQSYGVSSGSAETMKALARKAAARLTDEGRRGLGNEKQLGVGESVIIN